ncbi:hypothetical protein F5Y03DRAFT_377625, partial [Xylaria venustula]
MVIFIQCNLGTFVPFWSCNCMFVLYRIKHQTSITTRPSFPLSVPLLSVPLLPTITISHFFFFFYRPETSISQPSTSITYPLFTSRIYLNQKSKSKTVDNHLLTHTCCLPLATRHTLRPSSFLLLVCQASITPAYQHSD